MSEFQEIKKRIHKEEKIEDLLDLLECWDITKEQSGKLIVAGLPDGDNPRSVQVKNNENLTSNIRSKGIDGDVFFLVSYIIYGSDTKEKFQNTLHKSKFWICQKLGYVEYIDEFYKVTSSQHIEKPTYNSWLKKLKSQSAVNVNENKVHPYKVYNSFGIIPYKGWIDEGLYPSTQKEFEVGIDVNSERITFTVHNRKGELIGIKGRYCGNDEKIKNQYKYIYLLPCNKSIEFFNFHRALPYIEEKKEVIIVEGGKTTMFLHQWGFKNSISIEGDSLSDYQIKILKELGLDIRFIFAYDKGKDAEFVVKEASKLHGRLRYGIYDVENLLEDKDSPTDKGKEVWEHLYLNNQYKIN
ncbi:DNA primase [Cytobacillus gottheilii]|uniref:DNA primase n=1 Tax=Cytobacillus gottheilii TaxID=859144 RepID=UPI0009BC559E|nr:DNA primase [Cytobacillus gottheilii]